MSPGDNGAIGMAGSVSGYVTAADGAAVSDASVFIAAGDGPVPDVAAISDDAGGFALDGIATGEYLLRALGPDGEVGQAPVSIRDGETSVVRIVLDRVDEAMALGG